VNEGAGEMNRLQKFVEKGPRGEGPFRTAYVLDVRSLPQSDGGNRWNPVNTFSPADELLNDPDLKAVFKVAIDKRCAVVKLKAKGK
jgi:hypothetical protein